MTLQKPGSALSQVTVFLLAVIPAAPTDRAPGGHCHPSRNHLEYPRKAPAEDVSPELCGLLTECQDVGSPHGTDGRLNLCCITMPRAPCFGTLTTAQPGWQLTAG